MRAFFVFQTGKESHMSESKVKLSEYKRTVVCECGVELDLRTQGLLCPGCRAKFKMERKRNIAAACDRFFRRQSRSDLSEKAMETMEALIEEMERLVRTLDSARAGPAQSGRATGTPAAGARRSASPRHTGGIPVDRLELE